MPSAKRKSQNKIKSRPSSSRLLFAIFGLFAIFLVLFNSHFSAEMEFDEMAFTTGKSMFKEMIKFDKNDKNIMTKLEKAPIREEGSEEGRGEGRGETNGYSQKIDGVQRARIMQLKDKEELKNEEEEEEEEVEEVEEAEEEQKISKAGELLRQRAENEEKHEPQDKGDKAPPPPPSQPPQESVLSILTSERQKVESLSKTKLPKIKVLKLEFGLDAEDLGKKFPTCREWQWANEYHIVKQMREEGGGGGGEEEEELLLVPFMSKCWFNFKARYQLHKMDEALERVLGVLRVQGVEPRNADVWRRLVWIFPSGVGPTLIPSWKKFKLDRCMFLLAEGDRAGDFYDSTKDVIIPGVSELPLFKSSVRPLHLLYRGGQTHQLRDPHGREIFVKNQLRDALVRSLYAVPGYVVGEVSKSYREEMKKAKLCLIPRGNTPWTRRIFDALISGCIPVVLSNSIVFPLEGFLSWKLFSVKWPEAWAMTGRLQEELERLLEDAECLEEMREALAVVAPLFLPRSESSIKIALVEAAMKFKERSRKPGSNALHHYDESFDFLTDRENTKMSESSSPGLTTFLPEFWNPPCMGPVEVSSDELRQVGPSYRAGGHPYPSEELLWRAHAYK